MLCGGPKSIVDELEEVFRPIATKSYYFGPVGSGMRYKLILNFLQALHIAGFGEAMRMAEHHHLNLPIVAVALADRPGGSLTQIASERYFHDPDPITFSITNAVKDLTYAKRFAEALDVPLLDTVLEQYRHAQEDGFGESDWGTVNSVKKRES